MAGHGAAPAKMLCFVIRRRGAAAGPGQRLRSASGDSSAGFSHGQALETTNEHPFGLSDQHDFSPAREVAAGDQLMAPSGISPQDPSPPMAGSSTSSPGTAQSGRRVRRVQLRSQPASTPTSSPPPRLAPCARAGAQCELRGVGSQRPQRHCQSWSAGKGSPGRQ